MVLPPHIKTFEEKNVTFYTCEACNKTFRSRDHCRYHRYCHSVASKPFSCSICDKKFAKKSHLSYHELTHTGELPFKCGQCDKGFRTNQKLKRHLGSHSGKKLVSCYICDKQLSNQDGLRVHLRTHSESRPFKCDQCNATFKERHGLTKHSATHSDEKNWVCEVCGKKFAIRWNLIQHKRTVHPASSSSVSRPFSCEICHQDFLNQFHLKRHMKRHLTIHSEYLEEYVCKICDKVFTRKDNLSRHVKNSHFEDEDPRSETINDCIKESKQKVVRKVEPMSAVMQENTNRLSVIKSVASVMRMTETSTCEKEESPPAHGDQQKNSTQTKDILELEGSNQTESYRTISVISRIGRSGETRQKTAGFKMLPPPNERLEDCIPMSDVSTCVAKTSQADSIEHTTIPFAQTSSNLAIDATNSQENVILNKQAPKSEPFRVINQASLALNLSAKKATYCYKKCLYDANKNFQRKVKEQAKDSLTQIDQVLHNPGGTLGKQLHVPEDQSFVENYVEYVDGNESVGCAIKKSVNTNSVDPRDTNSEEHLQSYRNAETENDRSRIKPVYSNPSYANQDISEDYRKIEDLEYSYYSVDPSCSPSSRTEKVYAVSHFSSSFANESAPSVKPEHSSVTAVLPNLIPIVSSKESGSSINCFSDEVNSCLCRDCLRSESQIFSDKQYIPSTSASLDLTVRKYLLP